MKTGVIIRGCSLSEEIKKEEELIEERVNLKVEDITEKTKADFNVLLGVFADEMNKKIDGLDKYKEDLKKEYNLFIEKNNEANIANIKELENKYSSFMEEQESITKKFLDETQESIKSIMMVLFEKFFYEEYQNPDNLNSLIKEGLKQLEDSKKVQISIHKELFSKMTNESIEQLKKITKSEVEFSSHTSESLLLELKSEQNNIEIDFDKQINKIKEVVLNF